LTSIVWTKKYNGSQWELKLFGYQHSLNLSLFLLRLYYSTWLLQYLTNIYQIMVYFCFGLPWQMLYQ